MRRKFNGRLDSQQPPLAGTGGVAAIERNRLNRRSVCSVLAASMAGAITVGCSGRDSKEPSAGAPIARATVPLRILLVGDQSDAEAIRLAWSMTMEQPLAIELFSAATDSESNRFADRMLLADVSIVPQSLLGEIDRSDSAVPFSDSVLANYQQLYGKPFPAVADGLGSYGGKTLAVATGAKLFAVLALDSELQCDTWAAYHDWIVDLDGNAAEPLATGWPATSFLNRCASSIKRGWLFNRMTMQPEIDGEDYVAVLEQLLATSKLYQSAPMDPREIWQAIRRGELKGGIGYEVSDELQSEPDEQDKYDISVLNCPLEIESDRLWIGPRTPLACISTGCRQTDASKQFVGWISGGEGIANLRRQTERFSPTRVEPSGQASRSASVYDRWLSKRLSIQRIAPALILPGGTEYNRTLDEAIRHCLDEDLSPKETLGDVASQWQLITDRIGRKKQANAWKKALGFSAR